MYKDIRFPKGVDVNIPTYVLHRDPEVWENPLEFNPDNFSPEAKEKRDPYSFIPFGTGPRQCMGMRLALLEIKLGLLKMMQRFTFERAPETVATLEQRAVILMQPKDTIYVKIKARWDIFRREVFIQFETSVFADLNRPLVCEEFQAFL